MLTIDNRPTRPAARQGRPVREAAPGPRWWCPACGATSTSRRPHCGVTRIEITGALVAYLGDVRGRKRGAWSGSAAELAELARRGFPGDPALRVMDEVEALLIYLATEDKL